MDFVLCADGDIHKDLTRRDFTVNAIAISLGDLITVDPLDGLQDLSRRWLRMVDDEIFAADPIRLLRAVRQASNLEFEIESNTAERIAAAAPLLAESAGERIFSELVLVLLAPHADRGISLLVELNLLKELLRPVDLVSDAGTRAVAAVEQLSRSMVRSQELFDGSDLVQVARTRLAQSWSQDLSLSDAYIVAGFIAACIGDSPSRRSIAAISNRWALSRHLARLLAVLLTERPSDPIYVGDGSGMRTLWRWNRRAHSLAWAAVLFDLISGSEVRFRRDRSDRDALFAASLRAEELLGADPLVRGDELAELLDIPPGPKLGQALAAIAERQFTGDIEDRDDIIAHRRELGSTLDSIG